MTLDKADIIVLFAWTGLLAAIGMDGQSLWGCFLVWMIGNWFIRGWIDRWIDND
jgi:hypothetical protein